jgi:hypothetical protein
MPGKMTRFILAIIFILTSCTNLNNLSDKIEEPHYALYKQKVLLVYMVETKRVVLTNPARTRYYLLKGKRHTSKWAPGDTFVINNNLEDFYDLKFLTPVSSPPPKP